MENINLNKENTRKAILSYTPTPKEYLKQLQNLSNKALLFHLENFCLLCNDDYKSFLIKFNCIYK